METEVRMLSDSEDCLLADEFVLSSIRPLICCVRLDGFTEQQAAFVSTLSPDERQRAGAFRFDSDRLKFIVRRGLLRRLLSLITGETPESLRLQTGRRGKPFLTDWPDIHFSMSHSDELALFGFSRRLRIGVDIEKQNRTPDLGGMARTIFSEQDATRILALCGEEQVVAFFRAWTRLEALVKALGTGLTEKSKTRLLNTEQGSLDVFHADSDWRILDLDLSPGYAAALAREKVS